MSSEIRWDKMHEPCRLTVDITVPQALNLQDWALWSEVLVKQGAWSADEAVPAGLAHRSELEQPFITVFLRLSRWLLELGRLPVFAPAQFIAYAPKEPASAEHQLVFEVPLVDLMPQIAYETAVRVARDICLWMADHPPTDPQISNVFDAVDRHVIQALSSVVPAGKSTLPVLKVAYAMGIPFLHLGLGVYQLGWGSKARRLDRSTTERDSAIGSKLAQNKVATANLLRTAGLPAPTHGVVRHERDAVAVTAQLSYPLVVKPLDRDRGEGVTVNVMDDPSLKAAFLRAHELSVSKQVIVEKQVPGVCHRIFIWGGQLLYAVKRLPMSVQGDGRRTVAQLVADEVQVQSRRPPWLRSGIQALDETAVQVLKHVGLSPDSVVDSGVLVPLRPIESTAWGGVDEEVTHTLHPDNIAAAIQAAQLFGLDVAGVDIISADITQPWHQNGAIINEVNYAPLLGGGEISQSHLPRFLSALMQGLGTIPVTLWPTEAAALQAQNDSVQDGRRCFFTSAEKTLSPSGQNIPMPLNTLSQRFKALICRADVDAVVMCERT